MVFVVVTAVVAVISVVFFEDIALRECSVVLTKVGLQPRCCCWRWRRRALY